jgi:hypothetical protein
MVNQPTDEKKTGGSYIITFYEYVNQLNYHTAQHINLSLELDNSQEDALDEIQKDSVKTKTQETRFYVIQTMILYKAISQHLEQVILKKEQKKRLDEIYKMLVSQFVIENEVITEYVELMNHFLIGNVIKELLQTSQDIVKSLSDDNDR